MALAMLAREGAVPDGPFAQSVARPFGISGPLSSSFQFGHENGAPWAYDISVLANMLDPNIPANSLWKMGMP